LEETTKAPRFCGDDNKKIVSRSTNVTAPLKAVWTTRSLPIHDGYQIYFVLRKQVLRLTLRHGCRNNRQSCEIGFFKGAPTTLLQPDNDRLLVQKSDELNINGA